MAPIMGVTGCIYRNTYSLFFNGYDIAVMPFINNIKRKKSSLRDVLPERNNANFKLIPQILNKNPNDFIVLAKSLYAMGYETVNWNLGCPLPMVRKKRKGSGLLPYSDEIVEFLNKVIPAIPNQTSIKIRLGSENKTDLSKLLPLLNNLPLKEIIIHPRTGKQLYTGESNLDAFEKSLSLSDHTIVYSGDITSVEKYKVLEKRFPSINHWMIGRGGITNPFLPEQIKNIDGNQKDRKIDRFLSFHKALLEEYQKELSGQAHLIGKMKEVWWYWRKAFESGDRLFLKLSRTKNVKNYLDIIDQFFQKNPKTKY